MKMMLRVNGLTGWRVDGFARQLVLLLFILAAVTGAPVYADEITTSTSAVSDVIAQEVATTTTTTSEAGTPAETVAPIPAEATSTTSSTTIEPNTSFPDAVTSSTSSTTAETTTSTSSTPETLTSATSVPVTTVTLHIRYNDTLIFGDQLQLTEGGTEVTDNQGKLHTISKTSVLGALTAADAASSAFRLSDLAYYDSFGSFLINCLALSDVAGNACYNWQYVVNDSYPFVGIDKYDIKTGDDIYLYFGSAHRLNLSTSTVALGDSFVATAENYDYRANAFKPLTGVAIGATQPDPANPWSPLVIASSVVNELGQASFTLTATGTYGIGIAEDYFYPTVPLTVIAPIVSASTTTASSTLEAATPVVTQNSGGGGGGSSAPVEHAHVNVEAAINFLNIIQNADGSFGSSPFYADWVAIAFGSYLGENPAKERLVNYLKQDPGTGTLATDYERRAMALMALDVSPFDGTKTNYIDNITAKFDGTQIGDLGLVNDDIFAIFPLLKAGHTASDAIVSKTLQFIIAKQNAAGGWESPDLTAAAVQALAATQSLPGVAESLGRAKTYLHQSQYADGKIGDNSFATSWALQAIRSLGESENSWTMGDKTPGDYLASRQQTDGGLEQNGTNNDRIWATAYAIPATLGKPWSSVLRSFTKPAVQAQPQSGAATFGSSLDTLLVTPTVTSTPTLTPTSTLPMIDVTTPTSTVVTTTTLLDILPAPLPITIATTSTPETAAANSLPLPETVVPSRSAPVQSEKIESIASAVSSVPLATASISADTAPYQKTAKNVFGGAATFAGGLGMYLAWRFVQGLL